MKKYSDMDESRVKKMRRKLFLDDLGTDTGIHPLYRNVKEKLTGKKTLYHYTSSKNLKSILKNGFDPSKDKYSSIFEDSTGNKMDSGIYFGNQSKSIPRSTVISRYKMSKERGKSEDPGVMLKIKIPMKEYIKLKKRESDTLTDFPGGHKELYKTNPYYKKDYDSKSVLDKFLMRRRTDADYKHFKKDVVLLKEKLNPKYITDINENWS